MCGSWNIGHESDFGLLFALLPLQQLQKSKFWKNEKKPPRDIIISHMCTIYENHIMFSPWDMEHDWQNFWSLWTIFCPFTSLTTWKIKILKKRKNPLEISSFYISVAKIVIIWYTVPEIWRVKDVVYVFHFGLFFAPLPPPPPPPSPPNSPKKKNSQNIIKPGDIIILHICTKNYDHVMYSSWDMVRKGQTDRRTEKVPYTGGCPT